MAETTLYDRLNILRGRLSYRDFAEKCGISESGMRKYFPPFCSVPTITKAATIARVYGVSLEWLANGQTSESTAKEPSDALDESAHRLTQLAEDQLCPSNLHESARRLIQVADDQWCLSDQVRNDIRIVARAVMSTREGS